MHQTTIQKQIEVVIQVTKEINRTKESARQFLVDAGIIQPIKATPQAKKK